MSGTPDWKPSTLGVRPARPSSTTGFRGRGPSSIHQTRASPSIDLSGCYEHPPQASVVDHNRSIRGHVLLRDLPEPARGGNRNDGGNLKRRYPGMINVDETDAAHSNTPPGLERPMKIRKRPEHNFGGVATWGKITFDDDDELGNRGLAGPQPAPSQSVQEPPITLSQEGTLFITGWSVGAFFQHRQRRGISHRVYEGPPDGTMRPRIGPETLVVDFMRPYKIVAIFFNDVYLAVQFRVPASIMMDGRKQEAKSVWGNMRKGSLWLGELVDPGPEHIRDQESDDYDVTQKVRKAAREGSIFGPPLTLISYPNSTEDDAYPAAGPHDAPSAPKRTREDNDGNDESEEFSSISEANSLEQALAESLRTEAPGIEAENEAQIRVNNETWERIHQQASASSTTEPPRAPEDAE